jgi:TM2 domain-containing membrane protein YozV
MTGGNLLNTSTTYEEHVYYVEPTGEFSETHSLAVGYIFWLIGFTGAHRFYYGKRATGILWFFTLGLFGIGWLVDFFLIPAMEAEVAGRFADGPINYSLWVFLIFAGVFGAHRLYQEKYISGVIYLLTGGLLGLGIAADALTLNEQLSEENRQYVQVA